MSGRSLRTTFTALIAALLVVSLAASVVWTSLNSQSRMVDELREQGQALAQEMDAVWEFMASNQHRLEQVSFAENGAYQGLHCAIAGRSIAALFTSQTDYTIRFVNNEPRNPADEPDEFEAAALEAFNERGAIEYYAVSDYQGEDSFRYLAPMTITKNCLECHGEPAGEIDVTGYAKEGWKLGDVGGAISIVMPIDVYAQGVTSSVLQDIVFFGGMIVTCLLVLYLALRRLVTDPLGRIRAGFAGINEGGPGMSLPQEESSREMNAVVAEFNVMSSRLSESYSALESQVEERTRQLAQANERLTRDSRYKSDFLAMMSHELKTPLSSITTFAELLKRSGDLPPERREMAYDEIEANSRALSTIIEDILEMSRLDAGKAELNVEVIDLGDVAGLVASVIAPLAERKGLEFSWDVAADVPLIAADPNKVVHVLENLCGNAVRFTPHGGRVSLDVSFDRDNATVRCAVADTGVGIAEADHARVFERFMQADSSPTRHHNGTGLGLALAKEYAEMHDGHLELESELGKGSTFTLVLPAAANAEGE